MSGNDGQSTNPDPGPARKPRPGDKGYTGNPGGVPKWVKEYRDAMKQGLAPKAKAVADKVFDRALNTTALETLAGDADPDVALRAEQAITKRLEAAKGMAAELWSYILTKPTARSKMKVDIENPLASLTTEQLQQLAQGGSGK